MLDSNLSLICVGSDKRPTHKWKKYQSEIANKEEFESLYNNPNNEGVGICTGYNGLEVIDVDLKIFQTSKEQEEFWSEYISFLKDNISNFEDKFTIYKTINNGYHILYRCTEIEGNKKLAKIKGYTEAVIETRGIGGYVFVYDKKVSESSYYDIKEISVKDRNLLISCCKFFNYNDEVKLESKRKEEFSNTTLSQSEEVKPWVDFNDKENVIDIVSDEFEIIRTLSDRYVIRRNGAKSPHSGYIYKDSGCMFLFSTGTVYPNEILVTPFMAYTHKYHNGDFKTSGAELYDKGYGTRNIKEIEVDEHGVVLNEDDTDFPMDIFPLEIQNYIAECSISLGSSIDYMGCTMLWVFSVIIGNSIRMKVKNGWYESSCLWISLVGKAGVGKTPAISNIAFPLKKSNNREIKRYIKEAYKFAEFEKKNDREKEHSEIVKKPKKTQFIANDITLEALVELHEESKNSVGVLKDELAGWMKDMNKYRAGSDLEFWLSTWSGDSVNLNRKTAKSSFLDKPLIPVLGGIQPSILDSFYTEENKDNGFIDRMLFSFPDLKIDSYSENEMNPELISWFNDFVIGFYETVKRELIKLNNDDEIDPFECVWSEDSKTEWIRIFNYLTDTQNSEYENEYMKSMLPKQKSYIPRFSMIIHVMNCVNTDKNFLEVSKDSILKAEKLSKYFISMAKKIKINSFKNNQMKRIVNKNENLTNKQKAIKMKESNPDIKANEIADILGVSIRMIYKYLKK